MPKKWVRRAKGERRNGHRNGGTHSPVITRLNQQAFLQALAKCGSKKQAAREVGIDPATPHQWGYKDERFAQKMAEAATRGEQVLLGEIEGIIDARIRQKAKDPQSAVLTMFRTKRLDPRYRDNVSLNVQAQGPVAITFGLDAPQDVVDTQPKAIASGKESM